MILQFLGYQMTVSDLNLFLGDVASHVDQLHAVEQWLRDAVQVVGRGNEKHLRQVVINGEVVVVKRHVLLRVKHLEQRGGGITMEVIADLIYLIEYEYRVGGTRFLDVLDDAPRDGTDVSAAMAADLGFIM